MIPGLRHSALGERLSFSRRGKLGLGFLLFLVSLFSFSAVLRADKPEMRFIRDAEIEHYLRELGNPVFRAARLNPRDVNFLIVQNEDLNAFVAGGQNIFIYTGLLQAAANPEQLQGVIAHETGHIANGDLIRGTRAMQKASAQAMIGMVAALAAALATGHGEIAAGAGWGVQTAIERGLLSFSRAQESAADLAALRFLDSVGIGAQGLLGFMKKLEGQELVPEDRKSEYVRTHPLSQDRINSIADHLAHSPLAGQGLGEKDTVMHERMRAKLLGFLRPESALMRYGEKDKRLEARYARAIALYRKDRLPEALNVIDSLLKEETENPFFHELKGQMLFENGRVADSLPSYEKAVALLPSSALLRVSLAHALLESKAKDIDAIIEHLKEADRLESRDPQTWRFLAVAWSRKGELLGDASYQGLVFYALAEESLALGKDEVARGYAKKALDLLPKNSPYSMRAQDLKLTLDQEADN